MSVPRYDAVVVGAGPNGLAAAIALARAGCSTLLVEAAGKAGGGLRTAELTLPGFRHDPCASIHPLGAASPFFRSLRLEQHGLEWVHAPAALAHVLSEDRVVTLERAIADTAVQLDRDGAAYTRLFTPFVERFDELIAAVLGPLHLPAAPVLFARFGLRALRSMEGLSRALFRQQAAPALLAGIAAHAMLPLDALATASFGLVLASAGHAVGWPLARGGSQAIADALCACLRAAGGELWLDRRVRSVAELPPARVYVFDVAPKQLLELTGDELPAGYRRRLQRFRYGPGVFKLDYALSGPIPWTDAACTRAATVHLAGGHTEIADGAAAVYSGRNAGPPFVLLVQPTLFDDTRAPTGQHIAWAYCHVPHGSQGDFSDLIEAQIERYAPGFRELVMARAMMSAADMEQYDPNYVGGDINAGVSDLSQLFFRPVARLDPYSTPVPNIFLCSSSTPPGGGAHGMCGYYAARSVLKRVFGAEVDTVAPDS